MITGYNHGNFIVEIMEPGVPEVVLPRLSKSSRDSLSRLLNQVDLASHDLATRVDQVNKFFQNDPSASRPRKNPKGEKRFFYLPEDVMSVLHHCHAVTKVKKKLWPQSLPLAKIHNLFRTRLESLESTSSRLHRLDLTRLKLMSPSRLRVDLAQVAATLIRSYQMIWSDQIWPTLLEATREQASCSSLQGATTMIMQWSSYGILWGLPRSDLHCDKKKKSRCYLLTNLAVSLYYWLYWIAYYCRLIYIFIDFATYY
jgi:hypothetical protein